MDNQCNGDCKSCSQACDQRQETGDFSAKLNEYSDVKRTIGIASGKGGVGKTITTSLLAVAMNRLGYRCGILDADVTGPSIPKAFGLIDKAVIDETAIYPVTSKTGIEIISMNVLLGAETDPVVWRGPVMAGTVKQFYTDVVWSDIDFLFIDMPPGTGDVPLTVFQSIPMDGIIIVTTPQELVSMIVQKAIKMADLMNIPVLAIVENMSYFECPDCKKRYDIFGESKIEHIAKLHHVDVIAKIPILATISSAVDGGTIEQLEGDWLKPVTDLLQKTLPKAK
jgi:Mrp family chromosome partitioning ATPase